MPPSLGRIVHFRVAGDELHAAIITRVVSDERPYLVDLTVFTPGGTYYAESVAHGTQVGEWAWPVHVGAST